MRPPGIQFEDLPPIDAVVVSHNHYDHMDVPTLQWLAEVHHPRFFVGLGNEALLASANIRNVSELDWWQSAELKNEGAPVEANSSIEDARSVRVASVPTQHRSGRGLRDTNATLWCGYVIEASAGNVYFAGDTGYGKHFAEVGKRFGDMRLAILPIGAFLPRDVMRPVHISPEEAIKAQGELRAMTSVAIHFGTFPLAEDGETEAVETLRQLLLQQDGNASHFWVLYRIAEQSEIRFRSYCCASNSLQLRLISLLNATRY